MAFSWSLRPTEDRSPASISTLVGVVLMFNILAGTAWCQEGRTGRQPSASPDAGIRLQIQSGHAESVSSVAWSPDGRLLATASRDGTGRLWDRSTGKELRILAAHSDPVWSVAWSPDGRRLASASEDGTARLWDVATGKESQTIKGPEEAGPLGSTSPWARGCKAGWSPDGRSLATVGLGRAARIWEADTGKEVHVLRHRKRVYAVEWSPDGRSLATASEDSQAALWDMATGKQLHLLAGHTSYVFSVAWNPSGQLVATGSEDKTARVWDTKTGRELLVLVGHRGEVTCVAWSPDGRMLATASTDGTSRLWDAATGRELRSLKHGREVSLVAWSPDGRALAACGEGDANYCRLWDVSTGKEMHGVYTHLNGVSSIAWTPDGLVLATAGAGRESQFHDHTARLWDTSTGKELQVLAGHSHALSSVAWNGNGKTLATVCYREDAPRLWDLASGRALPVDWQTYGDTRGFCSLAWSPDHQLLAAVTNWTLICPNTTAWIWEAATGKNTDAENRQRVFGNTGHNHTDALEAVSWSPDGRTIATACADNTALLWDARSNQKLRALSGHTEKVTSVSWSSDGLALATASQDGTARLWDGATCKELHTLVGHRGGVTCVAWSPKGRRLATAGADGSARLWDSATGKQLHLLAGHNKTVTSVAFSPDGVTLATAGADGTARLWEATTGKQLRIVARHVNEVESLGWSPDGRTLVTCSSDCTTRLWDTATGMQLAALVSFDGGDWAVVSPEGFFDGSLRGLKQLHWVIGLDPFDLEQFFQEFYHPGLLKDVLEQHKPMSQILSGRKDKRSSLAILSRDRRPVQVAFESLQAPARPYERRKLTLTLNLKEAGRDASHTLPSGIKDVRVFNNGILVWRSPDGPVKPGRISVTVPIVAGKNTLTAYAFNRDNVKCRDVTAEVTGAKSLERQGQAWILAIGIDKYADPRYNLKYARADAEELASTLRQNLPIPDRDKNIHVTTLLDGKATRKGILDALRAIAKEAALEDTVIVTYAGHGMNHKGRFYLLPHDLGRAKTDEDLTAYGVSDVDLGNIFIGLNARHITLVLDACHSGQALESEEWRVGPMNARGLAQLAWEKGMDILTASQSKETAKEVDKFGHGLLTYALLKCFEDDSLRKGGQLPARKWLDYGVATVPQILGNDREVKLKRDRLTRGATRVFRGDPLLIQTPRVFHANEDAADWMVSGLRR